MAGRRLSPEERRLWERVAATAAPLHRPPPEDAPGPTTQPAPQPPGRPKPLAVDRRAASAKPVPAEPPRVGLDLAPDPHIALERANPHMDRRRFDRLRRGRLEPEARLDLHGMTSEAAHAALTGFILAAHARDLRLLLVITGKGRTPDGAVQPQRHGILRHSLPHWLAAPPLAGRILQVAPAHQRHGGGGAYYVYLRRRR
jgi:DNA-nicking Smr family endonuclease